MSHPEFESAVNSELAYATAMTYYTLQYKAEAAGLLAQVNEAYPE